jgi:tetratricopeptide (TPR) repeat protein
VHLRPNNVNYLIALAWLYEEIEDYVNAKKYYFQVLECEPTNTQARRKLNTL